MSASQQNTAGEPDLRDLLTKLTLDEKVSLLAGADWWRTVGIQRDDVFIPQLKVCFVVDLAVLAPFESSLTTC